MPPIKYAVSVTVTDLRREPIKSSSSYGMDQLQESQLLYGEIFHGSSEKDGWIFGRAINQPRFRSETGWTGYPGWIEKTHLVAIEEFVLKKNKDLDRPANVDKIRFENQGKTPWLPRAGRASLPGENERRKALIDYTYRFLSTPYHWGGRSEYSSNSTSPLTGVDCSGLVNLAYRSIGLTIPRDSRDQFLAARPITSQDLKSGDLIFTAEYPEFQRISHVMMYVKEDLLIEATTQTMNVRLVQGAEKLGKIIKNISNGEICGEKKVHFGSIFLFDANKEVVLD